MNAIKTSVASMKTLSAYSSLSKGASTTTRHEIAASFLHKLSGGESLSFLMGMLSRKDRGELWKLQSGTFGDAFKEFDDQTKRNIVASLGWPHTQFKHAGLAVGERLFEHRNEKIPVSPGGRPTKMTQEMKEQVHEEYTDASDPTGRPLLKQSKLQGKDVVARNMNSTYKSVYEKSDLADVVSFSTFNRYRSREFIHSSTRTDVCDTCFGEEVARHELCGLIEEHRKYMKSSAWVSTATFQKLKRARFEAGTPTELKERVKEIIETLQEVDQHKTAARKQRDAYNAHRKSPPPNTVVVVFDYKQKGKLPQHVVQAGQLYYNQGTYSVLGFCLYWLEGGEVREHHVDFLLRCTNQNSVVTVECFKKLLKHKVFPSAKRLVLWSDSGKHFRSAHTVSYFLDLPQTAEVNFFEAGHGKNECDSHFGVISRTLKSFTKGKDMNTLNDVQLALRDVALTSCVQPRLTAFSQTTALWKIPNVTIIGSFIKTGEHVYQHRTACDDGYLLPKKVRKNYYYAFNKLIA